MTRLVFQALPSGDCGQSLASWRARVWNAATLTPWNDGAAEAGGGESLLPHEGGQH